MTRWRSGPVDDFPDRRTVPWRLDGDHPEGDHDGLMLSRQPETELQALMETAPHDTPATSIEESMALRDTIADAIDNMDQRERWVFLAHVNRGMSFQDIGQEMGISKTHAHYLHGQARQSLQDALMAEPTVAERLDQ